MRLQSMFALLLLLAGCGSGTGGSRGSGGVPALTQDPAPISGREGVDAGPEPPGVSQDPAGPGGGGCVACSGSFVCDAGQGQTFELDFMETSGACLLTVPGQNGGSVSVSCDGTFTDPRTGMTAGQWTATGGGNYAVCVASQQNGRPAQTVCIPCMPGMAAPAPGTRVGVNDAG